MKKILVVAMAIMMTMGLVAQCPKHRSDCFKKEGCPVERVDCKAKKHCVYSSETRAMMRVDRIAAVVKDLTDAERKSLLNFYKVHFAKCEQLKAAGTPMTKEECRKACDAELRKVIGDDRYIQYLEARCAEQPECDRRPEGCPRGERPDGCPKR